jgi:ABC-2 type transport system ATP-binding protein
LTFAKNVNREDLAEVGKIKQFNLPKAKLEIKREVVSLSASELLKNFPIKDLNIEQPPIEDIIRELFTNKDYR